jgi:hypothetical protein
MERRYFHESLESNYYFPSHYVLYNWSEGIYLDNFVEQSKL